MTEPLGESVLVVSQSGRMLAVQLAAEGYQPLVIDCFADDDMQAAAKDFRKVENLSLPFVKAAFEQLSTQHQFDSVIYGSGLEPHIETLAFLQQQARVCGNTVGVFQALQQKKDFFRCLDHFAIPHPAVRFSVPPTSENWLFKSNQGEGGQGVCWATAATSSLKKGYWQQYIAGLPMSVLFLADGKQARIVGVHRQLSEGIGGRPFLFAGVIAAVGFSAEHRRQIQVWLDQLIGYYGLVGLNSLDFILAEDKLWLLEINARPSASLQLYPAGLLSAHIAACLGKNDEVRYNRKIYGGYKIVFADRVLQIPAGLCWPPWVCDRPAAGTRIMAGQPLCSLTGVGEQPADIISELAVKESLICSAFSVAQGR